MNGKDIMNIGRKTDEVHLDPGLNVRPATWDDLEGVAQLIYEVCAADGDTTVAVTPEELRHEWQAPGFDLPRDAFLVEAGDGRIVGYEEFFNEHEHAQLRTDGYVHPDFRGCGIGTALLRTVERRALEEIALAQPDLRVSLQSTTDQRDAAGRNLHLHEGYQPLRYQWRMEIVLEPAHLLMGVVDLRAQWLFLLRCYGIHDYIDA